MTGKGAHRSLCNAGNLDLELGDGYMGLLYTLKKKTNKHRVACVVVFKFKIMIIPKKHRPCP